MPFDPTGPGTPAWNTFDKAHEAWYEGHRKRYYNHRHYMIQLLRGHGKTRAEIFSWTECLRETRHLDPER